ISLPNVITLARLVTVPLIVWLLMDGRFAPAFWLLVAAGLSDAVDGYIARRFNRRTHLGAYLDPLADKALLVGVFVALGVQGHLPSWLVILVVSRDILIIGGALLIHTLTQKLRMAPIWLSKLNTVTQIVLAVLVVAELGLATSLTPLTAPLIGLLIWVVALTTVASGGQYVVTWLQRLIRLEDER
ncbi:MAG: CDP-alcohol phosphatidyltransferase family protein, partial [Alphaproteobacteria bacterium]